MVERKRRNIRKHTSASWKTSSTGNKRTWKTHDDGASPQRSVSPFMKRSRNASHSVNDVPRAAPAGSKRVRKSIERSRTWALNRDTKDAGQLSYDFSQKKTDTESAAFSFFAPSQIELTRNVELGLLFKKRWVSLLIGKKGETIKQIIKKTNANIDFGDENVVLGINPGSEKWEEEPWPTFENEKYKVCAISGSKAQATEAAKLVAKKIGQAAQSPNYKLEFLIPDGYCGIFVGKKGVNMRKMLGTTKFKVSLSLRDCSISLGDTKVSVCTIFGPAEKALRVIERASNWLGAISVKIQMDRDAAKQKESHQREMPAALNQPYPDERNRMSDRPLSYGDNDRDINIGDYRNFPTQSRLTNEMNPPNQSGDLFFY